MEVFGIIGMSFGSIGIVGFILSVNLHSKVSELEKRIIALEDG
jgi:hypothetical protein